MRRLPALCPLCGDPDVRSRTTVRDGPRARVVSFHPECHPRHLVSLRARRRSPDSLDRHLLRELGLPRDRARKIADALAARPPPPPPDHVYWYLLRTLRRTPPKRRDALVTRWLVRDRINDEMSWALASATDWYEERLRFPPVRRRPPPRPAGAPPARSLRLRVGDDLVVARLLKGRTDASAYVRRRDGTTARARPIYRDTYLGRIDGAVFARGKLPELRRVIERLQDARDLAELEAEERG